MRFIESGEVGTVINISYLPKLNNCYCVEWENGSKEYVTFLKPLAEQGYEWAD